MYRNSFLHFDVSLVHRFTKLNKPHDSRPPSLWGDGSPCRRTQWPEHFSVSNQNWKSTITRAPALHFPPSSSYRPTDPIDWLIDWSANQDASTTFYPEARWGTRLCSIHTDATMLPPSLPPPPPPLSAHLPITHSPPRSTPTQAWALDRITSVSTNPSVSRHYIHYWQSQSGGIVRASCFFVFWCISCWNGMMARDILPGG